MMNQKPKGKKTSMYEVIDASPHVKLLAPLYLGAMAIADPQVLLCGSADDVLKRAQELQDKLTAYETDEVRDGLRRAREHMMQHNNTWFTLPYGDEARLKRMLFNGPQKSESLRGDSADHILIKTGAALALYLRSQEEDVSLKKLVNDAVNNGEIPPTTTLPEPGRRPRKGDFGRD